MANNNIVKDNKTICEQDKNAQNQLIDITESMAEIRQEVIALSSFFPSEFQEKNLLSQDGLIEVGRRLRNLQVYLWDYIERLNKLRKNYIENDVMRRKEKEEGAL